MRYRMPPVIVFLLIAIVQSTAAQILDCPAIVQTAIRAVDQACSALGRNELCYGNVTLQVVPQADVTSFTFEQAGDMVDIADVQSLTLSSLDTEAGEWGVALMQIQADLTDTLPGQSVTFLMFGDVEVQNAVPTNVDEPAEDTQAQVDPTLYAPMQAFYFKTGVNDSLCAEAPDSGILIQSPAGDLKVDLIMNEVSVSLGSTVYIQAQPDGEMIVNVLEGQATGTAFGTTVVAPAGTRFRVPLDADLAASGPPTEPEPYDAADFAALPLTILPEEITVAPGLAEDSSETISPLPGDWVFDVTVILDCGPLQGAEEFPGLSGEVTIISQAGGPGSISIFSEGSDLSPLAGLLIPTFTISPEATNESVMVATMNEAGFYVFDDPSFRGHFEIRFISPEQMEGTVTSDATDPSMPDIPCIITQAFTGVYVGE